MCIILHLKRPFLKKKGRAECADNFLVYASELLENEMHFRVMSHLKTQANYKYENRLKFLKPATLISKNIISSECEAL